MLAPHSPPLPPNCPHPTAAAPPQIPPSQCSADTPATGETRTTDAALPTAKPGQSLRPSGPGTKSPQRCPRSSADCLQFSTSATGSRPQAIQFQRSVRRQLRRRQRRLPQPLANRTLDAAHPVSGAGVAQSLRGQTDGDVTVFLENRWWRISSPSSVMPPAIRRHCPQRNTGICKRTSP